jgi:hypothetical protein
MQFVIRRHPEGWLIIVNGEDQMICEQDRMARRIVREARLLLEQEYLKKEKEPDDDLRVLTARS